MPDTVDDYIAAFPPETRERMQTLRNIIRQAAPAVSESISYGMPTFKVAGTRLTYFAGWQRHIALYAIPRLPNSLETQVEPLRAAKDTLRLRNDRELPVELIERLVAALVTLRATET